MMKEFSRQLTVLVLSCDKYCDLWYPFFYCLKKYWPDCPYRIVLGSNTKIYKSNIIKTILSGSDLNWSTSLKKLLEQIQTPYVFTWLDDSFPTAPVDTDVFTNTVEFMIKRNAKNVHAVASPKPDKVIANGQFGEYFKGAPFRVITQGFWQVNFLSEVLLEGENPWSFEIFGSYRCMYTDGFYCTIRPAIKYINVVEKGKIFQDSLNICRSLGIPLDISKREVLKNMSFIKSELQKITFNTMIKIPWTYRIRVMNLIRRILISY